MENQGPAFAFDLADERLTYSRPPRGCSCEESPRALIRVKLRPGERPEAPPQHHLHLQFLCAASWTEGSPTLHSPGQLPSQTADNCLKAPLPFRFLPRTCQGPRLCTCGLPPAALGPGPWPGLSGLTSFSVSGSKSNCLKISRVRLQFFQGKIFAST